MKTIEILGEKAEYYLSHVCRTIDKSQLYLPAPDTVDKVWIESDRNIRTLGSLQWILAHYSLNIFSEIPIYRLSLYIRYLQIFSFGLNTHEISRF